MEDSDQVGGGGRPERSPALGRKLPPDSREMVTIKLYNFYRREIYYYAS